MPLRPHMKLLSVDDHLIEPPHVWQTRLPRKYLEDGPKIVDEPREDGPPGQAWYYEGQRFAQIGLNAVAGKKPEEFGVEPLRYADMIPGCYEPQARLIDMDLDGVHAALCFPSFPGFAGKVFTAAKDKELAYLCIQAWNDFLLDEWCAADRARFIPGVLVPMWDPQLAADEARRTHAKGAKTIFFSENPARLGLPSFHTDHWDPLFYAAEELDMPLSAHFGTSGQAPHTADDAPWAVSIALFGCNSMYAYADLVFSPVFHKHPNLKFALSEGGVGWLPYLIERCDQVWEKHRHYQNVNQTVRPSELYRKHIFGCFIDDVAGLAARDVIGVDHMLWEADYPHSDSHWPESRKRAEKVFQEIPDDVVHQIVELNPRRLFNFPG
jgi:predicted TIM-barrel fold metal-dependent hydrolase